MVLPDLLLKPPPKLTVQVVDERGKPVPKAIVSNGWWVSWQANERGVAEIDYPPPELWAASLDLTKFGKAKVKPEDKSVRIVIGKGVVVTGQVTDEEGKPVPNARVLVRVLMRDPEFPSEMSNNWFEVAADKQGQFRLHLPSGVKFILVASAEGFFPTETEPRTTDGKSLSVTVKMKRPDLVLEGKVVDAETEQPVWGAVVTVFSFPGPVSETRVAFTDEQGRFRLEGLSSERPVIFSVYHPAYQRYGGRLTLPFKEKQLVIRLERPRPLVVAQLEEGKPAPPLKDVKWLDGEEPSLKGKTTYLLFAAPYDPGCEREMQRLKELLEKSPEKVQVVVVFDASLPAEELRQYAGELNLPFRFGTVPEGRLSGWDSETFSLYGVKSVPMLVVIDEQGIVRAIKPENLGGER